MLTLARGARRRDACMIGGPLSPSAPRPMAQIEIYTTPLCPYCWRAKRLLESKGVAFVEIDLWQQPERRAEMVERAAGRTTVPQLFVNGHAIGGSDELAALERDGKLDALLELIAACSCGCPDQPPAVSECPARKSATPR